MPKEYSIDDLINIYKNENKSSSAPNINTQAPKNNTIDKLAKVSESVNSKNESSLNIDKHKSIERAQNIAINMQNTIPSYNKQIIPKDIIDKKTISECDIKDNKNTINKRKKIRDELELKRTIFISNINIKDKDKLKTHVSKYGNIESIRFRSISVSDYNIPRFVAVIKKKFSEKNPIINAYVVYKTEKEAQDAIGKLHNTIFCGRHLRVDIACRKKEYNPKYTVFIGNLPFDADEEEVRQIFEPHGNIDTVRLIRDKKFITCRGVGFIKCRDRQTVKRILLLKDIVYKKRCLRLTCVSKESTSLNNSKKISKKHNKEKEKQKSPSYRRATKKVTNNI